MTATSIERNTEKFNQLPKDFQEAIRMSDYDNSFSIIAKKHKLHIDQSAKLETILANLIFGELSSEKIISTIVDEINISKEEAVEIATEMNQMMIIPIKDNLKSIQIKKEDVE